VLGFSAPVAVGRVLGVPLGQQVRAVLRPALVTAALFAIADLLARQLPGGSWLLLVPGVAVTTCLALVVAALAGLSSRQRNRLVGRVRMLLRRTGVAS